MARQILTVVRGESPPSRGMKPTPEKQPRYSCTLLSEIFNYKESRNLDRHATCCGEPAHVHAQDGHEWVSPTHTPPRPTQQLACRPHELSTSATESWADGPACCLDARECHAHAHLSARAGNSERIRKHTTPSFRGPKLPQRTRKFTAAVVGWITDGGIPPPKRWEEVKHWSFGCV